MSVLSKLNSQAKLSRTLLVIQDEVIHSEYKNSLAKPYVFMRDFGERLVNSENITKHANMHLRLHYFRKMMGKFFSEYRFFDSCKEIDKDLNFGRKIRSFKTKIKMKKREHQMIVWENVYKMKYLRDIYKAVPSINIVKYRLHLSGGRVKPKFVSIDIKYIHGLKTYSKNIKAEEFKDLVKLSRKLCGGK